MAESKIHPTLVMKGNWGEVHFAQRLNDEQPVRAFLTNECPENELPKLMELFRRMAQDGNIPNIQKYKKIDGVIHEFKANEVRISCYTDASKRRCYLLHAFLKKQDAWPHGELQRAINLLHEHLEFLKTKGGPQ